MTTEKYKNRYRIASTRAAWWSYDWAGAYFITICTKNREHFFGHVKNEKMILSSVGELAHQFWYEIPDHAHNVELGAFQVMPNHIHGILILRGWSDRDDRCRDKACLVSTGNTGNNGNERENAIASGTGNVTEISNSTHDYNNITNHNNGQSANCPEQIKSSPQTIPRKRFRNQGKNTVSSMVGGYKSVVTKTAHQARLPFDWQYRFHDHIIRNDKEYQRINDYIESNPKRWMDDRFFHPVEQTFAIL